MSTGVSFLPDTYPICYNEAVDVSPARTLEQLEKENEDLRKEIVELRKEIARLKTTTPSRPPRAPGTTRGWTPSTAAPSPEKPFMRATRASKIREEASKNHALDLDSNKNGSPSFKSHFASGQGNHHYRPASPHNSTPSRRSSGPHYMQPTTASVQKKGSSSSTSITTPTPPRARQEPMPKLQMTRQVRAVRPVQQMQQMQQTNGNGNGNGSKSRNKTRQSTPGTATAAAAGSSSRTSAGNKGLDDSLWQAMQARSERPVPIPRRTDSQVSAVVEQDQTAAEEVVTPVGSGMLNGSKSGDEPLDSSPMASDV